MRQGRGLILAGDIGGTNARLAIVRAREGRLRILRRRVYPSQAYPGLGAIVGAFLSEGKEAPAAACFGVPGPVVMDRARISLLPWEIRTGDLAPALGTEDIRLLNDIEAAAHGIGELGPEDLHTLNPGEPMRGNRALIAAGTGLGQCMLFWDGTRHVPSASEGGHADFAPETALDAELLGFLAQEFGHVSWERVLSGPGIGNIYRFLRTKAATPEPAELAERMRSAGPAAGIVEFALGRRDAVCERTVEMLVRFYGREAGNLALKALAVGGLFVGGGIARKILAFMEKSGFMEAFAGKGRMSWLMRAMPVHVILSDDVGLLGAARYASLAVPAEKRLN